ncbi:sodium:calcium antiporter [Ruegeria marina]|uniref:Cation:H+ antiporter n=1 Tax=Ruegeria marina TaxID=639004 RepID=A0A1G6UX02_9RHOB|nr:hypothetical protein [Ruegeria marina]SDD45774.1 cation:H+ antiporter [Ruegeria marina]
MIEIGLLPLPGNIAAFIVASAIIWWAGQALAQAADAISEKTGLGSLLLGTLVLGGITSLPEVAVSVSAGFTGAAKLGVNNLLGSIALQIVVLALGDWILGRRALSFVTGKPVVLLQGLFGAVLLVAVAVAVVVGDHAFAGAGLWTFGLFGATVLLLWIVFLEERNDRSGWRPTDLPSKRDIPGKTAIPLSISAASRRIVLCAALILAAGYGVARIGDAIAHQSGLGGSFVGATFLGLTTSLPEISSLVAAVRLRRFAMAFGNIFGTNILTVAILFLTDIAYPDEPILNQVGSFASVAALLGATVTLLYVSGLVERRDTTIGRLGIDSWAVLVVYAAGVGLLYTIR